MSAPTRTLVFVYGSLRGGLHNHACLNGSPLKGEGRMIDAFRMIDLGSFPAITPSPGESRVVGEVYEIDEPTLARLDRLEGHPTFYTRSRVAVDIDAGELAGERVAVWAYFLPDPKRRQGSERVVACGDWIAYLHKRDGEDRDERAAIARVVSAGVHEPLSTIRAWIGRTGPEAVLDLSPAEIRKAF